MSCLVTQIDILTYMQRVIGPDEPITSEEDLARLRNESKEPGFKPFIFMIQHAVDLEAVDNHEYVARQRKTKTNQILIGHLTA